MCFQSDINISQISLAFPTLVVATGHERHGPEMINISELLVMISHLLGIGLYSITLATTGRVLPIKIIASAPQVHKLCAQKPSMPYCHKLSIKSAYAALSPLPSY